MAWATIRTSGSNLQRLRTPLVHDDERRSTVVHAWRVARGDRSALLERGLQSAQTLGGGIGTNRLVAIDDHRRALGLRDGHRQDFVFEEALVGSLRRALMAESRVFVLSLSRDVIFLGDDLARVAHVALLEGTPQPVVDGRINHLAVANPQPFPDLFQQIRRVARRFHSAGHGDVDIADSDGLIRQHHRFEARSADLVDREGSDVVGKPASERGLPRRILTGPCRDDVAHDALVHGIGIDSGTSNGLGHHERAQVGGGKGLEGTEELAGRGSNGADDH